VHECHCIYSARFIDASVAQSIVSCHEGVPISCACVGRHARRWIRGVRVATAPLHAHFVGRIRTTPFKAGLRRVRRSIPIRRLIVWSVSALPRGKGCLRIERGGTPVHGYRGAASGVKRVSFGGHGRSFVGWHLTTAWSDRGWRLRRARERVDD
jgi:hypothetical protein